MEPQQEKCRIVGRGDVAQSSYDSAVINLKFDGNWSPILKVALDVVGKYRYQLSTPRRDYTIPLIVDVALVGRTKVRVYVWPCCSRPSIYLHKCKESDSSAWGIAVSMVWGLMHMCLLRVHCPGCCCTGDPPAQQPVRTKHHQLQPVLQPAPA